MLCDKPSVQSDWRRERVAEGGAGGQAGACRVNAEAKAEGCVRPGEGLDEGKGG